MECVNKSENKMKKIIILIVLSAIISVNIFAQVEVPKKLLKDINIEIDEFTNTKTYYSKDCCLSIVEDKDSYELYISFSCSTRDSPMNLKKIYILVNGVTTAIEHNSIEFSSKEISDRVMTVSASGVFGTASYKPAVFGNRMFYIDTWRAKSEPYMELINSIILTKKYKVKFEGENLNLFREGNKKDISRMESILNLYNYLKSN